MLPVDQRRVVEEAKFTYSPLGKALEKQTKTIDDQDKKNKSYLRSWKATCRI